MRHTLSSQAMCLSSLLGLALLACVPAQAQTIAAAAQQQPWLAVGDATLSRLRGGFAIGDGLMVSLGITRALYINGALVTETSLHLNQLGQINATQAAQLGQQLQALNLVQNGPGNTFLAGVATQAAAASTTASAMVSTVTGLGPGTIVQNSLNGQNILNRTTIDASSTGLSLLRAAQLQAAISQAVQQSVGPR